MPSPDDVADADRSRPTTADPMPAAYVAERPVVFPHIPRTGGSTLKDLFGSVFGTQRSRVDVHRYDDLDPDVLRSMGFVEGHRNVRRFGRVFGDDWLSNGFTMVREPVSRVVSQARHIRSRRLNNALRQHVRRPIGSPAAVFEAVRQLNDLQCRMLATSRSASEREGPRTQLDRAKATLDQMAFGLTEAFDASVALFAEHFGLWLPAFTQTNASPRYGDRDLRTEAFRQEARRRNERDLELYAHARDVFWARASQYVAALDALDLDDAPLACELRADGLTTTDRVVARGRTVRLEGWVLVDGHAPDAVVAKVGERAFPVACGLYHRKLGLSGSTWDNRYGGVRGTIEVPDDVGTVELVAVDRRRGRRAVRPFPVDRHVARAAVGEAVLQAKRVPRRLRS